MSSVFIQHEGFKTGYFWLAPSGQGEQAAKNTLKNDPGQLPHG
jgi:hypothetical protein